MGYFGFSMVQNSLDLGGKSNTIDTTAAGLKYTRLHSTINRAGAILNYNLQFHATTMSRHQFTGIDVNNGRG